MLSRLNALLTIFGLAPAIALAATGYDLRGRIDPPAIARVSIYGATAPLHKSTRTGPDGQFIFRALPTGAYTIAVDQGPRGEVRRTFEIGPGTADAARRISVTIELTSAALEAEISRNGGTVSTRALAIPPAAWAKYQAAQHAMAKPDVAAAVRNLNEAVERAQNFMAAWNQLGTIAYQEARYTDAERNLRRALDAEPDAFEPLVNLGGVLLNLARPAEALEYNRQAVARRPNDALANSQLGMSELALGNLDSAQQHLEEAKRIDPSHFSHPQLLLAQIHLRRGEQAAARAELEDFVRRHPDAPDAPKIHEALELMRR